ncbi:MAG: UDP-N-acetylmuramate--L-alanine ligase [Thermodesulfobacteriota bacterium]
MYRGRIKKVHFVGIGGSGMNGIAEVLLTLDYRVSGSDLASSETTKRLEALGAVIHRGHKKENVEGADCVVYSSAVGPDNPELKEAAQRQIPIIPRAEMLAELMKMKHGIAVAGTHGKTTTTSMIAAIMAHSGMDPTMVVGGKLNSIGTSARLGSGEFLVAEADESDGTFLKLAPTIAVVTSIDREHMDYYNDMSEIKASYLEFINKVPFYGCAVLCLDHPAIQELLPSVGRRFISYGLSTQADVHAVGVEQKGGKISFEVRAEARRLGSVVMGIPGEHNVQNALAAVAVARELDIGFDEIRAGLEGFAGVERRFQIKGIERDVMVVDDYGHHPVEIKAVLKAARAGWKRRLVVVFQPHRHSRTRDLFTEFIPAFNDAEKLVLTETYSAGEKHSGGASAEKLYRAVKEHGHKDVSFVKDLSEVPARLVDSVRAGDMVITLGAGDVWKAGEGLLDLLKEKRRKETA